MSRAEREFDAMVMDKTTDSTEGWRFAQQDSPDGLGDGSGRWRVLHDCADPRPVHYGDIIECRGCGQSYNGRAYSRRSRSNPR